MNEERLSPHQHAELDRFTELICDLARFALTAHERFSNGAVRTYNEYDIGGIKVSLDFHVDYPDQVVVRIEDGKRRALTLRNPRGRRHVPLHEQVGNSTIRERR